MLTIAQVERETGLSKDVLRVWERRYGFPAPIRSESGERVYDLEQIERLHVIKRLIDRGFRPGKLFSLTAEELQALAQTQATAKEGQDLPLPFRLIMDEVLSDDNRGLRQALSQLLAKQGLQQFVLDTVPQLNEQVGNLWAAGKLGVHQEHLYSEELSRLLRTAIGNLPTMGRRPRVLLTTLPGEEHGLGLLMVEGVLAPEGVHCLSLGVQTPMEDIVRAVVGHVVDVLVLSFSAAFPPRQGVAALRLLRNRLPGRVEVWAGGSMTRATRAHPISGVHWTPELSDCLVRLADWRDRHPVSG
ncbi:MAG: MerR family transcriptional regulator [Hydrogenophilaceae bacterium]|nr:MerR family transcriptional regulator [Hydrogenophilaceae bacterium]